MMTTTDQPGYFLFSLDTELAWGHFDMDERRARKFSPDGSRERRSIERLLAILDDFGIVATWALVGHLFYERCEECAICPVLGWRDKYGSFEQIYQTSHTLWYGADVVEMVLAQRDRHEIAFHGYTHEPFDVHTMDREAARTEVQEWLRVGQRKDIIPETVIFPRNIIGHLDVFQEAGFICYRANEDSPRAWGLRYVGKVIKSLDHILGWSAVPTYRLDELEVGASPSGKAILNGREGTKPASGLVNLRSSQHFFGFNRTLEMLLDRANLHTMRIRRMARGVRQAADAQKVVHIWAHPWEFQTEKDFDKLRYLFGAVETEVRAGRLRTIGMAELAKSILERQQRRNILV